MSHPSEEQLITYRYGEEPEGFDRGALAEHLAACEACRKSYDALERVLAVVGAAPFPERGEEYGRLVWQRIRPRLDERRGFDWRAWLAPQRWVPITAVAVLVLAAFLAGRYWPRPETQQAGPGPEQVRERILLVAVGDHLDRAQIVLVELTNADGAPRADGEVDISGEQQRAEDLLAENRLYRQAALHTGDATMASVLEELERVLLEIAHSPAQLSSARLEEIRRRIEARGILFKVRFVGSQVREREKTMLRAEARASS